jgi:hypothetical protein
MQHIVDASMHPGFAGVHRSGNRNLRKPLHHRVTPAATIRSRWGTSGG